MIAYFGMYWLYRPTLLPALIIGIITIRSILYISILGTKFHFPLSAKRLDK
ncbi:hypothetical protein G7050_10730 [Dysgonomonas sp. HDW5A]|nr:hypothetical protein G7050_10730 [Dysgonomonas sp. HDW5A]